MSQYPPGQNPYGQYPQGQYPQGQYPPGQYPQPYVPGYASGMPENPRPTSVTVLAILGIILGGLGTLCLGCGTIMGVIQVAGGAAMGNVGGSQPQLSQGLQVFQIVAGVLELILWVVLLFASIGALSLKPATRKLAINWSYAMLVWAVVKTVVQFAWVGPATVKAMEEMQRTSPGQTAQTQQMMKFMGVGMAVGAIVMFLLYVALPICFLIWWNKPHVKAAFGEASAAGGPPQGGYGGGPGAYPPAGYPQ